MADIEFYFFYQETALPVRFNNLLFVHILHDIARFRHHNKILLQASDVRYPAKSSNTDIFSKSCEKNPHCSIA